MTHKFHYQRPSSINPLNPSPLVSINISRRHTISNSFKRVSIISIKRFRLHPRRAIVVPAIVSPWPLSRKKWKVRDEKRKKEVFFGTIPCLLINSNERRWFEQGFHEWAFSSCYCASVNGRSGASVGSGLFALLVWKIHAAPSFRPLPLSLDPPWIDLVDRAERQNQRNILTPFEETQARDWILETR